MASAEPTAKAGWEVKTLGEVCSSEWVHSVQKILKRTIGNFRY